VLPGLTAGRLAVQQAGWQSSRLADEIVPILEIFRLIYWMKYSTFRYV